MTITDDTVDKFAGLFAPYYLNNYGIQFDYDSHKWYYRHRNMCCHLVKGHLTGNFWIGVPSTWYTHFGYIDIDNPLSTPVDHVLELLRLDDSEHYKMSSPGFSKEGKIHIIYKPQYKFNDITRKLYHDMINPLVKSTGAQLFPQGNRIMRLPRGRNQSILDENGIPLDQSPEEFMFWIDKLDYYETSEKITHQTSFLRELYSDTTDPFSECTVTIDDARMLEKIGLFHDSSRHNACLTLAIYYYRLDYSPEKSIRKLKKWLRKKHFNRSKQINKGRWWFVDNEIEDIVSWVYEKYSGSFLPDSTHNFKYGLATPEDVQHAVSLYRGDWINIKRTIALFKYCRMRRFFPWIYIPVSVWDKIASHKLYIDYQNDLLKNSVITNVRTDYHAGRYSKSFKITQPRSVSPPIADDNRAVTNVTTLLLRTFGTPREVVNAAQLDKVTAWRLFNRS